MRLVVVSNRVSPRSGGIQPGGLTVGLEAALAAHGGIWFGWSGRLVDGKASPCQTSTSEGICRITIDLPRARFDGFYNGFSNQCLWPLFHGRGDLVRYSISDYADYRAINSLFAAALARHLRPDDVIWIHDYHLIPLGQALRELGIRNRIGFFLHIPFPGGCGIPDAAGAPGLGAIPARLRPCRLPNLHGPGEVSFVSARRVSFRPAIRRTWPGCFRSASPPDPLKPLLPPH